jgi:hypothetical protein
VGMIPEAGGSGEALGREEGEEFEVEEKEG